MKKTLHNLPPDFNQVDAGKTHPGCVKLDLLAGSTVASETAGTRLNAIGSVNGVSPRGIVQLLLGADGQRTPPTIAQGPLMWRSRITGNPPGGTKAEAQRELSEQTGHMLSRTL